MMRGEERRTRCRGYAARSAADRTLTRHGSPQAKSRGTWKAGVNPRAAARSRHCRPSLRKNR
eukprot:9678177-Alexandrium_andersonii.AAC.1